MAGPAVPGRPADWPATTFMARLSAGERERLLRLGRREEVRSGGALLHQGDDSRHVLVLLHGRASVTITRPDARRQRVAVRSRGDLVGELAFLDARPRSASVIAVGPVNVLNVTGDAFDHFLDHHPAACRTLARLVGDRLRSADRRQGELSYSVKRRIAAALCQLATPDSNGPDGCLVVATTQRELAQKIDAATVSVHRVLRELAGLGLVETRHESVVIRDFDGLADLAGPSTTMHHLM